MDKHLHIVCHDVPWPVDHGGYVDLFYKIKALYNSGIQIHLHCFTSGREKAEELNKYCYSVNYYKRKKYAFSLNLPYIVSSRKSADLLRELQKDEFPILLEGIHCTFDLYKNKLDNKRVFVRLHNVEFLYYDSLSKFERNPLKRLYYKWESFLLKNYEKGLASKAVFISVSEKDEKIYRTSLNSKNVEFLPVFIDQNIVTSKTGKGNYCLYHGNLSVNENEAAVMWLLKNVFNKVEMSLIIAGRNPTHLLSSTISKLENVDLISNPSKEKMSILIEDAHINILPSMNNTGVKLKIINALFKGRFCLVNTKAIEGDSIAEMCIIADTPANMISEINRLKELPFTDELINGRKVLLNKQYNNSENSEKLISLLFRNYQ